MSVRRIEPRDAHDLYAAHGYREYRARFIKNPAA
jgi:hypothetical protein